MRPRNGVSANGRDCVHGHLARSCEICDLEYEIVELRAALGIMIQAHDPKTMAWNRRERFDQQVVALVIARSVLGVGDKDD